ncbi:KamA family radical SAM protein [Sunxiuqinia sp. A32]|uniref:KamA family radical SAM protein n=1 Tax=Sunxiuqinia sp. A32 TaxID=3461496 RepID=UPI004045BB65
MKISLKSRKLYIGFKNDENLFGFELQVTCEIGGMIMTTHQQLDKIAISVKSHRLLKKLLRENPKLGNIMQNSRNETEALVGVRNWVLEDLKKRPDAYNYYKKNGLHVSLTKVAWSDYAAIRILDYIDHAGNEYIDQNLHGELAVSNPIKMIWLAVNYGTGGAKPYFFQDMLELFRQYRGVLKRELPSRKKVEEWMDQYPSGLDPRMIKLREENRDRIIQIIIKQIDEQKVKSERFRFETGLSGEEKYLKVREWWNDHHFHLKFAVRSPDLLNKMLGESLDPDTMKVLYQARDAGIPFFVNPYYLSLLHVRVPYFAIGADLAIRDYIIYQKQLVDEFGEISAWEKEDKVKPGEPNAAGFLLPSFHNIHRRYPEVAILIPDTAGRTCGGLCAVCQRMFDFQNGNLNFDIGKLRPIIGWKEKLRSLMDYFENDSQLRDILLTGGDALMSSDQSLKEILEAIYEMAKRKKQANKSRKDGEKYAEIVRVRIGTRLPIYLPQRISLKLIKLLADFKKRASEIGIQQFVIQTHIESAMEMTPESRDSIRRLLSAGWTVTNQLVFTASASRRGHAAKLRKVINDVGILSYYTFTVKGYMENNYHFAVNARSLQEQNEEKVIGKIPKKYYQVLRGFPSDAEHMVENIDKLRQEADLPFLSTDRSVLNLPGVGKSMTFRVIGITRYGRRILMFEHDETRKHSPIIYKIGQVIIIESKSISEYLQQLENMGEDIDEYKSVFGYSIGETEYRIPIYEYPSYNFVTTKEITNLELS